MSDGRVRILSVDGGGIRGIVPATVLADLERRAQRPVAELFDLVAGTSTGGLIALALTRRGEDAPTRRRTGAAPRPTSSSSPSARVS
jgi:patatin-like phospholipase/acyl hydrolase